MCYSIVNCINKFLVARRWRKKNWLWKTAISKFISLFYILHANELTIEDRRILVGKSYIDETKVWRQKLDETKVWRQKLDAVQIANFKMLEISNPIFEMNGAKQANCFNHNHYKTFLEPEPEYNCGCGN